MAIFSRTLTRIDIERRLTIPRYCVEAFPHVRKGQPAELKIKDEMGNVWTFHCSLQSSINPRPVFCSGWLQFVRNKNLHVGDTIIVHKGADDATEAFYNIEVRKTHDSP